jgi:hypothetical protein
MRWTCLACTQSRVGLSQRVILGLSGSRKHLRRVDAKFEALKIMETNICFDSCSRTKALRALPTLVWVQTTASAPKANNNAHIMEEKHVYVD